MNVRIIIVGDGKVGYTLAEHLSMEEHDVTIIDRNEVALRRATENLDVMCIKGNGASLAILEQAGVERTDVFIAVTTNDEMNMVCCLTAKKLGAKHTAARIRDPGYAHEIRRLQQQLDINLVINPEQSTAAEILRLLRFPSANVIDTFTRGRVELIGFRAQAADPIVGVRLSGLKKKIAAPVLICAVERGDRVYIPRGDFEIQPDDRVCVMGDPPAITAFFKALGRMTGVVRDVMIVGGGRIAHYLARDALATGIRPTVIEIEPRVCEQLAEALPGTTVIAGDGTEQDLLEAENIRNTEAFVALTGRDEDNLMLSLFALQCGVRKVIAKANRQNYNSVVRNLGLESVVSPKEITANHILHFVRGLENSQGSGVETLYRILDGRVEALEFVVKKDTRHLGKKLKDLPLRTDLLVGVITRRGSALIPTGNDSLSEGDRVVIVTRHSGFTALNEIFDE